MTTYLYLLRSPALKKQSIIDLEGFVGVLRAMVTRRVTIVTTNDTWKLRHWMLQSHWVVMAAACMSYASASISKLWKSYQGSVLTAHSECN